MSAVTVHIPDEVVEAAARSFLADLYRQGQVVADTDQAMRVALTAAFEAMEVTEEWKCGDRPWEPPAVARAYYDWLGRPCYRRFVTKASPVDGREEP